MSAGGVLESMLPNTCKSMPAAIGAHAQTASFLIERLSRLSNVAAIN